MPSGLVLERTTEFPDRTRGEWLSAWGVLEARRLGIEDVLRSARGHVIRRHISLDFAAEADGRQSTVRRQCGMELHTDEPHHLFSGLIVDGG